MKKNITINLFGTLYAIDEDACALLEQYLSNMKSYFGKREGGDEIADDIEHRVAEIFADLRAQGVEAISIEHVQDVISRIGNPEEMDDEAGASSETGNGSEEGAPNETPHDAQDGNSHKGKSWFSGRRLYRDTDDQLIGGVMSGICKYFGFEDPLPWRIVMVLLAIFSFSTMAVVYIILWLLVPAARTAEERLKMRGRPVNPQTLNEELMKGTRRAKEYVSSPAFQSRAHGCLGAVVGLIAVCIKFGLLFVVAAALIVIICLTCILGYGTFAAFETLVGSGLMDYELVSCLQYNPALVWEFWAMAILALILIGIVLFALLRWILRGQNAQPLRRGTVVTLVTIALIAAAALFSLAVVSRIQYEIAEDAVERIQATRNGVYICQGDRDLLASQGWSLPVYANVNEGGYIVERCHSFTTDGTESYFKFKRINDGQPMKVRAERAVDYPAGRYRLEAVAFSQGSGTYIYALAAGDTILQAVPMDDIDGRGTMKNMSLEEARATQIYDDSMSVETFEKVRGRAKGWSYVRTPSFYHAGGPLRYGITNDSGFTHAVGTVVNKIGLKEIYVVSDSTPALNVPANADTLSH